MMCFVERDEVLFFGTGFRIFQNELPFAADGAADFDDAVDLGDLGRVFRTARFEQFGHTRQTAGDVLGLRDLYAASWPATRRRELSVPSSTMTCAPAGIE